jgi:hypothetical protein
MLTKTTTPIMSCKNGASESQKGVNSVIGTEVEYRIFGILLYRKTMYTPVKYGCVDFEYQIRI